MYNLELLIELGMLEKKDLEFELQKNGYDKETKEYIEKLLKEM